MKKTVSINIAGFVFNIEETAYEQLGDYLAKIKSNFVDDAERDEIMDDIEYRIAELFHEKISKTREVIIEADIDEIISTLGHPTDFANEDEEKTHIPEEPTVAHKRLFRDRDGGLLGGVCSGLGHYFSVDPLIFRALFIILLVLFGTGVLLYILLIFIIPEAKTTADKIEMKGRSVNVETIKEHLSGLKDAVSDSAKKSKIKDKLNNGINRSVELGKNIFETIGKIVGVGFIVAGIFILTFLVLFYFGDMDIIPFIGPDRIPDLSTLINITFPGEPPSQFIFISLVIVSLIPVIWLIIAGVKLLIQNFNNIKRLVWTLVIIWTVAACYLLVVSVQLGTDMKVQKTIVETEIITPANDTLLIDVLHDDQFSDHIEPYHHWDFPELLKSTETEIYNGYIHLEVISVDPVKDIQLEIRKYCRGSNKGEAIKRIENINYPIEITNDKLIIPPYLSFPVKDKMRGQFVMLKLFVPTDKTIIFGENITRISQYSSKSNRINTYTEDYLIDTNIAPIELDDNR